MVLELDTCRLVMVTSLIWRCVEAGGALTIVVVVAVTILPSLVEGENVVVVISAYDIE